MEENLTIGRVIKIYGTVYYVKAEQDEVYSCRLRGKLKLLQSSTDSTDPRMKDKLKYLKAKNTKNPIVVGDVVEFIPMESEEIGEDGYKQGFIYGLKERQNKLSRSFVRNNKVKEHLLASNIDYVLCVNSVKEPRLNTAFIDRILVSCEKEAIGPIIIVNKIDMDNQQADEADRSIFTKEEARTFITDEGLLHIEEAVKDLYQPLGYKVIGVSATEGIGLEKLKELIKGKIVVLTGYSGVGKSTIINSLLGKELQRVASISSYSKKGKHTTTTAELVEMPGGGYIIDTPGLREFGIYEIDKDDLYHYYRELKRYTGRCRYTPCTHSHEPDCAVKEAVEAGEISRLRYQNYIKILNTLEGI
jgi:ribosome biogenesis GTPase